MALKPEETTILHLLSAATELDFHQEMNAKSGLRFLLKHNPWPNLSIDEILTTQLDEAFERISALPDPPLTKATRDAYRSSLRVLANKVKEQILGLPSRPGVVEPDLSMRFEVILADSGADERMAKFELTLAGKGSVRIDLPKMLPDSDIEHLKRHVLWFFDQL